MLEWLLGTRCSSVSVRGSSVVVDLIKGAKGPGEPEENTSSVDLTQDKLNLKFHSQELVLK